MAKKSKYYVVWEGNCPGIYTNWNECERQTKNFAGAQFRSYESREEAEEAFRNPFQPITAASSSAKRKDSVLVIDENGLTTIKAGAPTFPILDSLAVDAACSGNPGVMEYQGVYIPTRKQLFHYKTPIGTNNIGEFLAIVHGLSYLKSHNLKQVLYSDSVNAINWVKQKTCKSKLPYNNETKDLWDYIHRAEGWLHNHTYTTEILKWDTESWGEIPADFNRK